MIHITQPLRLDYCPQLNIEDTIDVWVIRPTFNKNLKRHITELYHY